MIFNAVDGKDVIPLNSVPLRDRSTMNYNGHVSVSLVISGSELVDAPEVSVHGINTNKKILNRVCSGVQQIVRNEVAKVDDIDYMKRDISYSVKKLAMKLFNKRPLVAVHIHQCA